VGCLLNNNGKKSTLILLAGFYWGIATARWIDDSLMYTVHSSHFILGAAVTPTLIRRLVNHQALLFSIPVSVAEIELKICRAFHEVEDFKTAHK
jgi:hypothetical protein